MVNNSSYKPPDTLMTRVDWFSLAEELSADESEWNLTNWYVAFNFSAFGPKNETTLRYIVRHFTHIVMADRLALTIAYIIVCTPLLILQLTSLPIFVIHKNYWRNVCFRILFTNGCIDSIQLAAVLTYAVRNLWPSKFSPAFCRVGGAIVIPAYSLTVLQHFLLALNRFLVIMRARHMGSKWSRWIPDEEKEARIFNIAHVLCWQLYFAVVGLYLTPFVGANFNRNYLIFIFDITFPYTETLHALTTAVTLPLCVASFCIYCLIVCTTICSRLKIQKTDSAVTSSKAVGGRKTATFNVINDYEMRLLIQAIILYTSIAYLIIVWQFFDRCTSAALCEGRIFGKVLVDIPMRTHSMITGLPWMIFSGLSPILFLIMNKEFRSRYSRLYTRKSPDELSEIFSNSISTLISCSSKTEREESDRQSMGGKKLVKGISHDAAQQMRKKNAIEEMNKRKITH